MLKGTRLTNHTDCQTCNWSEAPSMNIIGGIQPLRAHRAHRASLFSQHLLIRRKAILGGWITAEF